MTTVPLLKGSVTGQGIGLLLLDPDPVEETDAARVYNWVAQG